MTTANPLEHFEIGYDRHYTGTALHCLLCPDDDDGDPAEPVADDVHCEPTTLADIVRYATDHLRTYHGAQYGAELAPRVVAVLARTPARWLLGAGTAVIDEAHEWTADQLDAYHARIRALRDERANLTEPGGY